MSIVIVIMSFETKFMLPEVRETLSFITTYHTAFHLQLLTKRDVLNDCANME